MNSVTGCLQKKNGVFHTVIYLSTEIDGKTVRKPIWRTTKLPVRGNQRKAESILKDRIAEIELKLAQQKCEESQCSDMQLKDKKTSSDMLFSDFMRMWLESIRSTIQITTYGAYEYIVCRRICPYFDEKKILLSELSPMDIQEYYNSILAGGAKWNSVMKHHANIHKALKYAVKMDMLAKNPCDKMELPKRQKFIADYYTEKELNKLFEIVKGTTIEVPVLVASFYGLRKSEVLGLKWDAIDFERKTISIRHTVCKSVIDGKQTIVMKDTTKNKASYRTLPLVPPIEKILLQERQRQILCARLCRKSYHKEFEGYICINDVGELFKPEYVTNHFKLLLRKNDMRVIRFHDLRHSCASLLLANNVSLKEIQVWLGHSDFSTTANTYSHLEYNTKVASANTICEHLKVGENVYE